VVGQADVSFCEVGLGVVVGSFELSPSVDGGLSQSPDIVMPKILMQGR
jgi:hypothetical protein